MSRAADELARHSMYRLVRVVHEATFAGSQGEYSMVVYECSNGDSWDDPTSPITERCKLMGPEGGGADIIGGTVRPLDQEAWDAKYPPPPPPPEPVITPEMPRVSAFKCGDCSGLYTEPDDQPCWECSRCGQIEASEDRQCPECKIFRRKVAPASCPHCAAAHGGEEYGEPATVRAVDTAERGLVEVES